MTDCPDRAQRCERNSYGNQQVEASLRCSSVPRGSFKLGANVEPGRRQFLLDIAIFPLAGGGWRYRRRIGTPELNWSQCRRISQRRQLLHEPGGLRCQVVTFTQIGSPLRSQLEFADRAVGLPFLSEEVRPDCVIAMMVAETVSNPVEHQ